MKEKKKREKKAKTLGYFLRKIRSALKKQDKYIPELENTVMLAAGAMRNWTIADVAIEKAVAAGEEFIYEETKYGQKKVPNPAFRLQREEGEKAARYLKALGLTMADVDNKERDPLTEFDERIGG
ncbi:MAG TPA: hypothetical protein H9927_05275 [Candidatus Alistipes merdipullorum]|nr:hypothetical protein [Candidatus Alistipes merdipullorum]